MASEADPDQSILLKNLVPLNALSDEHLGQLISRIRMERLSAGGYLFREGDTDHEHVYLLEGRISLLSGGKVVDSVKSGSNTARFALAHHWPRKFSARAAGEVRFARIDSQSLSELLVRTQTQSYKVSDLEAEDASEDWMSQVLLAGVLQQIPASNIQGVLRRMESVNVEAGERVISQGEPGEHYYVIIRGIAGLIREHKGKIRELASLGPGDGFGEESLITGQACSASIRMESDGSLMRLAKEDFSEFLQQPLVTRISRKAAGPRVDEGAGWLDVRSAGAFADAHTPGAVNLPLELLRKEYEGLNGEVEYLVYGDGTNDADVATFLLRERGFAAVSVDGNVAGVKDAGPAATERPMVSEEERDSSSLSLDTASESIQEAAPSEASDLQWQRRLKESQTRFQKALFQRISEIRQLKQSLDAVTAKKAELAQNVEELGAQNADLRSRLDGKESREASAAAQQIETKKEVAELQRELDDLQQVLQEASAEESRQQWEHTRLEAQIKKLQSQLEEQRQINMVLREENEETTRRMDDLYEQLNRLQGHAGVAKAVASLDDRD